MTRVSEKTWNMILPQVKAAIRDGLIPESLFSRPDFRPTHVIDIYKMRRGRYKNVRLWIYLHLGTGERHDLFMTTADNQPVELDLFYGADNEMINWRQIMKGEGE